MTSTLDKKTKQLEQLLAGYDTNGLLKFIAFLFIQMEERHSNEFLKGLLSPLRQLVYAADVSVQTAIVEQNQKIPYGYAEWDKDWEVIKKLLIEIEQQYFLDIGFHEEEGTPTDRNKIAAVLPTFMNYFFNGALSYPEQDIERLERTFEKNKDLLLERTGLTPQDIETFYDQTIEAINDRINASLKFWNPKTWQAFTASCIAKGLTDPMDWIAEAPKEINDSMQFVKDPGATFVFTIEELITKELPVEKIEKIIALLTCTKDPTNELIYYTQESLLLSKPIFKMNEAEYLIFYSKQIINAAHASFFESIKSVIGDAAYKQRDVLLEQKTAEVLTRYFKGAHIYTNYSVDRHHEQDILLLYKGLALIVEVKAGTYREPMRHPGKAYEKLKSDFKNSIQYGYNQTLRVKKKFERDEAFPIYAGNGSVAFTVDPRRYPDVFSIVVTLERLGNIQSDLSILLQVDDDEEYPWSVCIDDLEVFLLALKKKSSGTQSFRTFLKYRQVYHGHIICGDELEMCAFFMDKPKEFIELSHHDDMVTPEPTYTQLIDKLYKKGLGFKKERHWKGKRSGTVGYLFSEETKGMKFPIAGRK